MTFSLLRNKDEDWQDPANVSVPGIIQKLYQSSLTSNSILNDKTFYGGKIRISHHTFIHLFGLTNQIFSLRELTSFHAIVGNDALKELSAVIHAAESFHTKKINTELKQRESYAVKNILIRTGHMNT